MRPYLALLQLVFFQLKYLLPWVKPLIKQGVFRDDTIEMQRADCTRQSLLARIGGRSERIRPIDAGSDGGPGAGYAGIETLGSKSYGIKTCENPQQATLVSIEGPISINSKRTTEVSIKQMPVKKYQRPRVVVLGSEVRDGGVFQTYAVCRLEDLDCEFDVVAEVEGISPSPKQTLLDLVRQLSGLFTR